MITQEQIQTVADELKEKVHDNDSKETICSLAIELANKHFPDALNIYAIRQQILITAGYSY